MLSSLLRNDFLLGAEDDGFEACQKLGFSFPQSSSSIFDDFVLRDQDVVDHKEDDQPRILSSAPNYVVKHDMLEENSSDIVLALSDKLESLPPDDEVFQWHRIAAMIEFSSGSMSILDFSNIHLSHLRELDPCTYSCDFSFVKPQKGHKMFLLLVAVKQFAGGNPMCVGVLSFLEMLLTKNEQAYLSGNEDFRVLSKVSDNPYEFQ
mmetsp:Transcript_3916/g.5274  ORF Transcript_3916/g.5274 Transcript_3916/m.5274 type:complete len:206 (-) Transcript_3916:80-697(-)|eukprot:CAMPEP_0185731446 /NCGR_PEP_ID=MMETSP1171-20130828/12939_1 /TAXON_ID=374046 /ORGANISM="Helicotheca tamensis, Strain CCMP826" /LENGTH=205 /DNA_ID=CAMNT_0028400715 /DNA_START=135 /DNA_END=752 /DNA_ORIENTATION=+